MQVNKGETEKILDYWFALEFLSQDKYPDKLEVINGIKSHKQEVKSKADKKKMVEDFILLRGSDISNLSLYDVIKKEALECNMRKWGNITFYLGKVKRESCIECISKVLPFDSKDGNRPEKSSDKIALISLQLSPDGKYLKHSLSISTIVWALNQIKTCKGNISGILEEKLYNDQVEKLEDKFFDKEKFDVSAVTFKELRDLYKEIEKRYLHCNMENTENEHDVYEEVYGVGFQLFKDESTKNKKEDDNYLGLNKNYYSNDIKLVLNSLRDDNLDYSSGIERDIIEYINILNKPTSLNNRINVINATEQGIDTYHQQVNEIMAVRNAPLGKWPSKFMPAFMQQMAINLAIGKGKTELFSLNGNVFSVNGPPGTGKTTLLKEIVVNNIIERARLLAQYDDPEDAFEKQDFIHGEKYENAYSYYTRHWYTLKNDEINNYGMLVTSCNNAAVENITKELPKSVAKDLKYNEKDCDELKEMLQQIIDLFDPEKSEVQEKTFKEEVYNDIYFTKYAKDLLDDNDVWGLVAAPLGKKSNISKFYSKVMYPLHRDFYRTKEYAINRMNRYKKSRDIFVEQLKKVQLIQENIGNLGELIGTLIETKKTMDLELKKYDKVLVCSDKLINEAKDNISELECQKNDVKGKLIEFHQELEQGETLLQRKKYILNNVKEAEKEAYDNKILMYNSVSLLTKIFKRKKYKAVISRGDEYKKEEEEQKNKVDKIKKEIDLITNQNKNIDKKTDSASTKLEEITLKINNYNKQISDAKQKKEEARQKLQYAKKEYDICTEKYNDKLKEHTDNGQFDTGVIIDKKFVEELLSKDKGISTKAQVQNPWFTQRYNIEREKLFAYAMRMNKEFVISSNCCRDNLKTLAQYWGIPIGDDKERIVFHKEDKERMVPALFQTLFLLVPVISSTFASIGNLLRDVKKPGALGMLVVDEAGQAQPQMALGALFRCRKAVIVGDPKQVEPVVTDDLLLLKKVYKDEELKPYKSKILSVQSFADQMNAFGTYFDNGSDYKEWVGCPLLVHRRCISPMYDISNQISYNGIMKQQTELPKKEDCEKFIFNKSQWINLTGQEKGNRNHFVELQAKKVCELLEIAFEKNPEPSIYIITPFTTVVTGIKNYITNYCNKYRANTKIKINYLLDSEHKKIGTVHTFQGKEADEVIFLLGCDRSSTSAGAIKWVNKNIVNVAATRAKYRLYIIGDEEAWKKSISISEAKQIMDTIAMK